MEQLTPEQIAALTPEEVLALIQQKEEQLSSAASLIGEQSARIDQLSRGNKNAKLQVKVGEDIYEIIHGLKLENTVYTPQLIADNPDVAAQLVKSGSTSLRKVIAEEAEA